MTTAPVQTPFSLGPSRLPALVSCGSILLLASASISALALFGAVRFWWAAPSMLAIFAVVALQGLSMHGVRSGVAAFRPPPPGAIPWLLFLVYAGAKIPFSDSPYDARIEFLTASAVLAAYWGWSVAARGRTSIQRAAFALAQLLFLALAVYAIVQDIRGSRGVMWAERDAGYGARASGSLICPNHFANIMAVAIPTGLSLAVSAGAGFGLRTIGLLTALASGYALILTQSRSGVIGAAVAVSLGAILIAARKGRRWLAVTLVALPVSLAAAGAGIWFTQPDFQRRIGMALAGQFDRPLVWRTAIAVALERPVLGHGAGTFQWHHGRYQLWPGTMSARQAHNEYLNTWAEYGGVGLALALATIAAGGIGFLRRWRRAPTAGEAVLYAGLIGACAGSLVHALSDFNHHIFATNLMFALWAGTLAGRAAFSSHTPGPSTRAARAGPIAIAVLGVILLADTARSLAAHRLLDGGRRAAELMDDGRADECFARSSRLDGSNAAPFIERAGLARLRAYWSPNADIRRTAGDRAMALYREALRRNPCLMEAELGISLVLSQRGEKKAALAHLDRIVAFSERDPYYRIERGVLLRELGRMEAAEADFRAVLAMEPGHAVAEANLKALRRARASQKALNVTVP